jgi:hypothetical protein
MNLPSTCYDMYTKLDIARHKMLNYKILKGDDWKIISRLRNKTPILNFVATLGSTSSLITMTTSTPISILVPSSTLTDTNKQ